MLIKMHRIYECDLSKKGQLTKVLEADPMASDSFARAGYKIRDGATLGEDKTKIYMYISADTDFIKKADERLKDTATPLSGDKEKHVLDKIIKEQESAESGFGSMFG